MAVSSGPGYCFQPQSMRLVFHHNEIGVYICIYIYKYKFIYKCIESVTERESQGDNTQKAKKNIAQHNK